MTDYSLSPKKAVLIAGPTASGKSAFALELAARHQGVIINADSMQLYAELSVLSARPSREEEAQAPHRLYGFQPMEQPYSVADWLIRVEAEISAAKAQGLLPIITGGTGLYFQALTRGLAPVPDIPDDIRAAVRLQAQSEGPLAVHRALEHEDPVMAVALQPTDSQRLIRALEVIRATGRSLHAWQKDPAAPPVLPLDQTLPLIVMPDRAMLYQRINARFDLMIEQGGLDEARAILAMGLDPSLPAMKALGLPQLIAHLAGKASLDEAVTTSKTVSRRYAKRQMTWFRNQMSDWVTEESGISDELLSRVSTELKKALDGPPARY